MLRFSNEQLAQDTYDGPLGGNATLVRVSDQIGTLRGLGDNAGNWVEKCLSLPFGDGQNCTNATTGLFFTGKRRDTETGNDYFGARYYASRMGSWMSPDWSAKAEPVPYAKLGIPQMLNLYGYVLNNPLTVADPDGHATQSPCADGQTCGFIANTTAPSNEMSASHAARVDTEAKAQHGNKASVRQRLALGVKGLLDAGVGINKVHVAAGFAVSTPVTGIAGGLAAAYGAISGTGQAVQGFTEMAGAVTGHVEEAKQASDAIAATTTIGGVVTTIATGGNVKAGAMASDIEQLGTAAATREIFSHIVENGLSFFSLTASKEHDK